MRQIVLDTETTGLEPGEGHRIIEVGCVELVNRRPTGNDLQIYLNPDRAIDIGAIEVHGITNEFLADKRRFADVADELIEYLDGAELIIHNAPFDLGFLNSEYLRDGERSGQAIGKIEDRCSIIDTLQMARKLHPGQRNSLDALCKRYEIDNSQREKHGALLDSEILADVYLAMTGGQGALLLDDQDSAGSSGNQHHKPLDRTGLDLQTLKANEAEQTEHQQYLELIRKKSNGQCHWDKLTLGSESQT